MSNVYFTLIYLLPLLLHSHLNAQFTEEENEKDYITPRVTVESRNTGIIALSNFNLSSPEYYLYKINAPPNASSIHLLFRQESALVHKNEANNDSFIHVEVYDQDPDPDPEPELAIEWYSGENNFLTVVNGSEIWLVVTFTEYNVTSNTHDGGGFDWSIAYAVQYGDIIPECDVSRIPPPENGVITGSNHTFGSMVNLQCSDGYLLQDGPEYVVCSVVEDSVSWIKTKAICSSICNHPPLVEHATAHILTNSSVRENKSCIPSESAVTMATNTAGVSTTAFYVCEEPYILTGSESIECGNGSTGVPQWFSIPPSCIIPVCEGIIYLSQYTGEIVSPSYNSSNLSNNSQVCNWAIQGPSGSNIYLNVTLLNVSSDLPDVELPDADLWISVEATTPALMRELSKRANIQNWSTEASEVHVEYRRPSQNDTGYTGFLLRYLIIPRDSGNDSSASSSVVFSSGQPDTSSTFTSTDDHSQSITAAEPIESTPRFKTEGPTGESTKLQSTSDSVKTKLTTERSQLPTETSKQEIESSTYQFTSSFTEWHTGSSEQQSTDTAESTSLPLEQTTEPTTATSTKHQTVQSSVGSSETSETREPPSESPLGQSTEHLTESTTESTQEQSTESQTKPSTESPQRQSTENQPSSNTEQTSSTASLSNSSLPQNGTRLAADDNDGSNDDWKIAVGIVIPLIFLVTVLVGVYICYRKKYPVRMIIGREFAKFSNPNYRRRGHIPSLVREDADFYFTDRNSSGVPSQDFNPANNKITYDNMGFVKDEADDEEEMERKFLESKSWLFKKTSEEPEGTIEQVTEVTAESSFIGRDSSVEAPEGDEKLRAEKTVRNGPSTSEIIVEQTPGPTPKPRHKKKALTEKDKIPDNGQANGQPPTSLVVARSSASTTKLIGSSLPRNFGRPDINQRKDETNSQDKNEPSKYLQTSMKLFQQPTFDQVWAEVKARSRSLSVDLAPSTGKTRSISVDPSKSARKMSLLDEHTLAAESSRSFAAQRMRQKLSDETHNLTAFIVGVDIRDRDTSFTSSVLPDDEILDLVTEEVKGRNNSTNSLEEKAHLSGDHIKHSETHNAYPPTDSVTSLNDDSSSVRIAEDDQFIDEEHAANGKNYDITTNSNSSNKNQIDYLSDSDNINHHDNNRPFQLPIDNTPSEEIIDATSEVMPSSALSNVIDDPVMTSKSAANNESKVNNDINQKETPIHVFGISSTDSEFINTSRRERSQSSHSKSSCSDSDNDRTKPSKSKLRPESKLKAFLGSSPTGSNEVNNEATRVTGEFGEGNIQDDVYNLGDIDAVLDMSHELSSESGKQPLGQRFHERRSSSASSKSVTASSEASQSVSSGEDETTYDFSANSESQAHLERTGLDSDDSNEELANNYSLAALSALTPSHLHGNVTRDVSMSARPETPEHVKKVISELQFSDSSSDSSDIVSRKDARLLSKQPQSSASAPLEEENPAPISLQDTQEEISDDSSLDDVDAGEGGVVQSMTWSDNTLIYRLRNEDSADDDIDV